MSTKSLCSATMCRGIQWQGPKPQHTILSEQIRGEYLDDKESRTSKLTFFSCGSSPTNHVQRKIKTNQAHSQDAVATAGFTMATAPLLSTHRLLRYQDTRSTSERIIYDCVSNYRRYLKRNENRTNQFCLAAIFC